MSLAAHLMTLADAPGPEARDQAAAALFGQLQQWAPAVIRRRFPTTPDDVVDEAIQKVLLKASLGRSRFRGDTEAAARAWCNRILQRYALDWILRNRKHLSIDDTFELRAPARPDALLAQDIVHLLERLDDHLATRHRPRDLSSVRDNLRCHLEQRLAGHGLEEQIARWAATDAEEGTVAWRRARDRVYQYRRRGKVAGCQAIVDMLEQDLITGVEADLLIRLLGCNDQD